MNDWGNGDGPFDDDMYTGYQDDGGPQGFPNHMDYGPNGNFGMDRRQSFRGGFRRGGWRGFNQDRGWGPPPPSRNFNRLHMGQGFEWGRGFGPAGPPIQKVGGYNSPLRYLMRCGVSKEKLKNLPRDFFQLIFPEHCGICNVPLQSFEISRAHYVSQFHYKNQKDWVFHQNQPPQQFDAKRQRPKKEALFKPRESYCELCDVQITSESHAISHYSGRPHRAIVERRKKPKNARLLKKGMDSRIDQLINREKKFLKPLEVEPKAKPEPAAIPPELFCEICKTSVTCAEQMRMHLNGKKHLSKEKQHILKMMKGDTEKNGEAKPEEVEKEEKGEDAESQEEPAEGEEGTFDWGNGSGAWDEPAVQQ